MGIWTMTNIFMHGILYQVMLASESMGTFAQYYTRMHYMYGASSLGGRLSWGAMIVMAACTIPLMRRKFYRVRRTHHDPPLRLCNSIHAHKVPRHIC